MPRKLGWLRCAALLLFALALLRPGERALPPIDRDEARYAQATMQMIETGDYLDVRFLDQPRYLQPAGIYWLQAAAVRLFGDPPARRIWVHRLVSQAGAVLAVLLTGWIGARLFGRNAGFAAAVLLASTALLGFEGRIATIDATQLAVVLAAQAALASIYLARDSPVPPRRLPAAVFWIAVGAGTMLKGPVTALVAFSTLAALALTERRTDWLRGLFWAWGVPLALLIVLPWFVAIGVVSHGDFFARSVGQNFLGKVASGQQAHGGPPGYYLALFTFTFGPASLLAVLAAPRAWARRREPEVRFCLCWIVPTWLVFEAVLTKLPHYVLPTYPAVAILTAAALARPQPSPARPAWRRAAAIYAAAWLLVWVVAAWAPAAALWRLEGALSPLAVGAAIVVSAALALLLREVRAGRSGMAIACAAAASLVWSADLYGGVWPRLSTLWIAPRVAELEARTRPCQGSSVASASFSEPSLPYLLGTNTVVTGVDGAALHVIADPACALALVGAKEDAAFRSQLSAAGLAPVALGEVAGIDWVTGRRLDLTLFSAASR
jgi:4-amino-4-deoxy-L-arabinose transferase-like glycosyltransferase